MMTSTCNRDTSNTDRNTIVQAVESHDITTSAALYYPSSKGKCWDDELLPSGD
ncbi:MAG: hypothetical protein WA628_03655 [Terriglobales bacterium]